jgi:hypothetical protein
MIIFCFSRAQESLLGCRPAGLTEGCRSDEGADDSRYTTFYRNHPTLMIELFVTNEHIIIFDLEESFSKLLERQSTFDKSSWPTSGQAFSGFAIFIIILMIKINF